MWLAPDSNLQANFIVKAQAKYYISFSALSERTQLNHCHLLTKAVQSRITLTLVSHTSHLIPQEVWKLGSRNAFSFGRAINISYLVLVISNSGPNGFLSFYLVDNSPFPTMLPQWYWKDKFCIMSYSKFFKVLSSHTEEQKLLQCHMRLNDHLRTVIPQVPCFLIFLSMTVSLHLFFLHWWIIIVQASFCHNLFDRRVLPKVFIRLTLS